MPQRPASLVDQILCDADLFHFGTDDFAERNKLMRKEAESRLGQKISKSDWRKSTIVFMEAHHFQTDYCRNLLGDKKKQNLKVLKQKEAGDKQASAPQPLPPQPVIVQPSIGKDIASPAKKPKSDRP